MKLILALLIVTLSGCASFNASVAGYNKVAVTSARSANDNIIDGIMETTCAVPVGAVLRRQDFLPVVKAACLPQGNASNPSSLFAASGVQGQ